MKIKKSDLKSISDAFIEVYGFVSSFLDFADDDQLDYISNLLKAIEDSQDKIELWIK